MTQTEYAEKMERRNALLCELADLEEELFGAPDPARTATEFNEDELPF